MMRIFGRHIKYFGKDNRRKGSCTLFARQESVPPITLPPSYSPSEPNTHYEHYSAPLINTSNPETAHDQVERFGDRVEPINIGASWSTLPGTFTSTLIYGPGVALDAGNVMNGMIDIRAGSLVGDIHVQNGTRRQDAYGISVNEREGRLELAVCDGIGSCPHSSEGAAIVATAVVRMATKGHPDPINYACRRLVDAAEKQNLPATDYATTMLWASVQVGKPDESWLVNVVHYGDGDIHLLDSDNNWLPALTSPTGSECKPDSFALPTASKPARREVFYWKAGEALVLATDGLSDHLVNDSEVGAILAHHWRVPPDRWQFLSQLAFRAQGAGDDRSAIVAWRAQESTLAVPTLDDNPHTPKEY